MCLTILDIMPIVGPRLRDILESTIKHVWKMKLNPDCSFTTTTSTRLDGVTEVKHPLDFAAQEFAVELLNQSFPDTPIVAEETTPGTIQELPEDCGDYLVL